jgi:hypothetical protein
MCNFFSFVTEPVNNGGRRFYFDWEYRKEHLKEENDSHSLICRHFGLYEDQCNKYEFNPLTKVFTVDQINSPVDDRIQAEDWVNKLDFKRVVEPLIIKPIVHPLKFPKAEATPEDIADLKKWASVGASVWASVRDSVVDSAVDSVWASVWDSVGASVWASVWDSVWASVVAYISSFFAIVYEYDFAPAVRLWERGIVASFDGKTWRLHSGEKGDVVWEGEF